MSLIEDFNKNKPGSKLKATVKEAGGLPGAVSKIKQAKELVDSIRTTIDSIGQLAGPFLQKIQQNNSGVERSPSLGGGGNPGPGPEISPTIQQKQQTPQDQPPAQQNQDQQIQDYFSSEEGISKIIEAIDRFVPLIGDAKLSEVKGLLQELKPKPKEDKKK